MKPVSPTKKKASSQAWKPTTRAIPAGAELRRIPYPQMARRATVELTYIWLIENNEAIIGLIPMRASAGSQMGRKHLKRMI